MALWQSLALLNLLADWTKAIGLLAAGLLVCPPWVWLAVRTEQCLEVITGKSIPFSKRKIWLIKILALMVGAGNVWGILAEIGSPWILAIVPAGIIVFFSLRDNVSEIVPPNRYKTQFSTSHHGRSIGDCAIPTNVPGWVSLLCLD